ncbi:Protein of unknown function DUF697 [Burkholderiaceae bacterium]
MIKKSDTTNIEELSASDMFDKEIEYSPDSNESIQQDRTEAFETKDYRNLLAKQTVKTWSSWAAAAGLVPMPALDLAAIAAVQVKMVYELCKIYDVPYKEERVQSVVTGVATSSVTVLLSGQVSGTVVRFIPYVGPILSTLIQPTLAFASTYALGQVFIKQFESGQSLGSITVESVRDSYNKQFEKAKQLFKKKSIGSSGEAAKPLGDQPQAI